MPRSPTAPACSSTGRRWWPAGAAPSSSPSGRPPRPGAPRAPPGGAAPPAGVQARLGELTRAVLPLTLAGGGAVALLGVLWGRPLREAVGSGLAIAVAAVPEGLPLVATVAQQSAARRLSRRGAVVRSARVLEALGRVDTVCFDKTGTLTENRLSVVRLVPLGRRPDEDDVLRLAAAAVAEGRRPGARDRPRRRRGRRRARAWPRTATRRRACPSPPSAGSPRRSGTAGWW